MDQCKLREQSAEERDGNTLEHDDHSVQPAPVDLACESIAGEEDPGAALEALMRDELEPPSEPPLPSPARSSAKV